MPRKASKPLIRSAELVATGAGASLEAPVLDQAIAVEGAEVGLGVTDVDRK